MIPRRLAVAVSLAGLACAAFARGDSPSPPDDGPAAAAAISPGSGNVSEGAAHLVDTGFASGRVNLVLGRIREDKGGGPERYEITVLADGRGNLKPGSALKISERYVLSSAFPPLPGGLEAGTVLLTGIMPDANNQSLAEYAGLLNCPIGWGCPRVIPDTSVKGVQAALIALQGAMPKHPNEPLDRAKALEFFKSKDYEIWALGASMLGVINAKREDNAKLLLGVLNDPNSDMEHVLWAYQALEMMSSQVNGEEDTDDDLHKDLFAGETIHNGVYDLLFTRLVGQSPRLRDYPPITAPAAQPDSAERILASVKAAATTRQEWENQAAAQIHGVKPEEQAATLLMGKDYWKHNGNLIPAKVTAVQQKPKGACEVTYTMEILADVRGSYKPGAVVKVVGNLGPAGADWIPTLEKGTTVLLGVKPGDDEDALAYTTNVCSPLGWRSGRPIPADHVKAVQDAIAVLQKMLPLHASDPLDHAKALELFKSDEYETWAIGVSMLALEGSNKDYTLVSGITYNHQPQLAQSLWVKYEGIRSASRAGFRDWYAMGNFVEVAEQLSPQLGDAFISSPEPSAPTAPATQP